MMWLCMQLIQACSGSDRENSGSFSKWVEEEEGGN